MSGVDPTEGEGGGQLDVEAAFADIVAHWDDPRHQPVGNWPAQEDVDSSDRATDPDADPDADADQDDGDEVLASAEGLALIETHDPHPALAPEGWQPESGDAEPEAEGYVPPEPPPLPRGDALGWAAWAAVLGGPAFLLVASLVWSSVGRLWIMLAVVAFIAGFATLVARLPGDRGEDDGDSGAVV